MSIHLKFGTASHGWLPIDLEVDGIQLHFEASYIPRDLIFELIGALSRALSREGTFVAPMNEEPTESEWTFFRIQDALVFSIVRYPGSSVFEGRGVGKKIVETSGMLLEIVLPFWEALSDLESRSLQEHYKRNWTQAFPTDALEKLTLQIQQLKPAAG